MRLIHEQLRDGAVYQVVSFGGQLVISVNSLVSVASWSEDSLTLSEEAKYTNNILSLFVKTKGDFILVSSEDPPPPHIVTTENVAFVADAVYYKCM